LATSKSMRQSAAFVLLGTIALAACSDDSPTDPGAAGVSATQSDVSVVTISGLPADGFTEAEITVTVRDAAGNPRVGETVALSVASTPDLPGAVITPSSGTTNAGGVLTASITSTSFGSKIITATVNPGASAVELVDKPTVVFGPTHLVWTQSPQTAPSGTRWGDATVEYRDADENTVTTTTRAVTIDLTTSPSAGASIIGSALTQTPVDGVATFDYHGIAHPGVGYRVTATPAGVHQIQSAESNAFNVTSVAVVDAATTLATVSACDDCAESVLFSGFVDFPFDGVVFGSVQVASNGFLSFSAANVTAFTNVAIPTAANPNAVVAGFWDDLHPSAAGNIKASVVGSSPDRRFVVEYENVAFFNATGSARFNIILHETTHRIQFIYGTITHPTAGRASGNSATVGIENRNGDGGIQVGFDQANTVASGMSMLFEYDGSNYVRVLLDP
jgi:hypothetical protein